MSLLISKNNFEFLIRNKGKSKLVWKKALFIEKRN